MQFPALLKTDFAKRTMRASPLEIHTDADNDDVTFMNESLELRIHRLVVENHYLYCISKRCNSIAHVLVHAGI